MTAPRRIVKGATYLITRRTVDRRFLLRPSAITNAVFEYALAVVAARYGILLHAYCVLSNHWHCVLTDPLGLLPMFERDLDSIVARALNASLGRWDYFWSAGSYSAVELLSPNDVLHKMVYVLANPVAAGLVRRGSEWPGLWSGPARIGDGPRDVRRPDLFFRKTGRSPEVAALELVRPASFESDEELRRLLREAIKEREDQVARDLARDGRSFLGARTVLAQSPLAKPATEAPRRGLNPRVASRDLWKRLEALGRLKGFLADYRDAWRAFRAGARATVFPEGTYWMRVTYGVACVGG